jgi:ATP-binding cassette subfamily B protein
MRRPFLAPEVIQSSAMDCGPAALKTLLKGFGVDVSYDRLREMCQTEVDGTSIDTLEAIANGLGVDTAQQMLPEDALLEALPELTPCLLVTSGGVGGAPHFIVVWSHLAGWFQIMDPGTGRRWVTAEELKRKLYFHTLPLHGEDWSEIISRGAFLQWLEGRLSRLGLQREVHQILEPLLTPKAWRRLCAVDSAARTVHWLVSTGQVTPGAQASRLFHHCAGMAQQEIEQNRRLLPPSYWFARPVHPKKPVVTMRGAVLLVPSKKQAAISGAPATFEQLKEPPWSLWKSLFLLLRRSDAPIVAALGGAVVFGAFGLLAEVMIYRASATLVQRLGVAHQRLTALAAFALFLLLLLLLETVIFAFTQRLGRHAEGRLRIQLLERLPRLPDSYFRSRLLSDMAMRAHMLYSLRGLPAIFQDLLRSVVNLLVTIAAVVWLQPSVAPLAIGGAGLSLALPWLVRRWVNELEDRLQNQSGALSGLFRDVLAGLIPLRTHGAERAMVLEQQRMMADWFRTATQRQRIMTWVTSGQALLGAVLSIALVYRYSRTNPDPQGLLLLLFWAQRIPTLGQGLGQGLLGLAPIRSAMIRLFEPLQTHQGTTSTQTDLAPPEGQPGARIELKDVRVLAGGQEILRGINLRLFPGEHVAIVGQSGAGKSSLVHLLLGLHQLASGQLLLDGQTLSSEDLFQHLQPSLAWVDPAVHLWNDTLLSNIQYGSQGLPQRPIAQVIAQADLLELLDRLPEGFRTFLGEGGALLSGGEGQRVRVARALLKRDVRLALLDEPFRGLDRAKRRLLQERLRSMWASSTMLFVTHDVADTETFPRVLVVEEGMILEDGSPQQLLATSSRYRRLLEADRRAATGVWAAARWRRITVERGKIAEPSEPVDGS